jgi:hypothetical protein
MLKCNVLRKIFLLTPLLLSTFVPAGAQNIERSTPLTISEADTAIQRAYGMIQSNLKLQKPAFKPAISNKPLTRDQLVARLATMYKYAKPKLRTLKPDSKPTKIAVGLQKAQQKELENLVQQGLVHPTSRLVTASSPGFSPAEFGTILGNFLTQISELSFEQDKRYSDAPSTRPK